MTGTLFLVATPIGNLEDITLRALRVLREVHVIAAEDTRRTGRLLAHYGISTPMVSFHEHNQRSRIPQLVARLGSGENIGLVTDAGTPCVSDPGAELVRACIHAGIAVDPVPGVSASLTAAVASGFPLLPLTVCGFAPSRSKDRISWLRVIADLPGTITFFEAPHRIAATLADAAQILGERQIMVGRELTKMHQEFLYGTAMAIGKQLANPRGEITVVVGPREDGAHQSEPVTDGEIVVEFGRVTHSGRASTRGEAIASVARKLRVPRRDVFAALERSKSVE